MKSNAKVHTRLFKQTSGEINTKYTQTLDFTHLHNTPQKTQKNSITIFSQFYPLHLQIDQNLNSQNAHKTHQSHNFQHMEVVTLLYLSLTPSRP